MIGSSGSGTVLRSSLQIRCEQEHIREVAIAPGDAAGPRCSGDGGEVGAVAGRGALGREGLGGRRAAGRGWCWWQLETLESAPTPLGAAAAANNLTKVSNLSASLGCVTRVGQGPLFARARGRAAAALGQSPRMGPPLDSESGPWRNFELLLLPSVSVFERDLAGGSAAELEMGVETAPGLPSPCPRPGVWGTASAESGFCAAAGPGVPPACRPKVLASAGRSRGLLGALGGWTRARPEVSGWWGLGGSLRLAGSA